MEILSLATQKGVCVYAVKGNWQLNNSIQSKIVAMAFAMASDLDVANGIEKVVRSLINTLSASAVTSVLPFDNLDFVMYHDLTGTPPPTDAESIQQRKTVVEEVYALLIIKKLWREARRLVNMVDKVLRSIILAESAWIWGRLKKRYSVTKRHSCSAERVGIAEKRGFD
jgi:hypothetical protein